MATRGAVMVRQVEYSWEAFSANFGIPSPPARIGSENRSRSTEDILDPNSAGKNLSLITLSNGVKCSSMPGIVLMKYVKEVASKFLWPMEPPV